ncbi:hypothetical protein AV530_018748 [Patagioenas fasciata monilis]|uniref:Uncharacterized protein n=1 Tax=Patagioenas fasciata monilis TaxID=372326 RepID=A0A1V4JJS8_PATFA|nr:hypothetical protein AV530_018748 [Patagioenas fasciata monilis]
MVQAQPCGSPVLRKAACWGRAVRGLHPQNDSRVLKRWAFMCAQLCETPWCKETLQVVRSMASVQRSRTLCHKTFFFHGFVGLQ